jgi:integrase
MTDIHKLTVPETARISKPGRYYDGRGLYLQVTKRLTKSWIFRFERHGVEHWIGLGPLHAVDLAQARKLAREARVLLIQQINTLQARLSTIENKTLLKTDSKTFDECTAEYIASHCVAWRNKKHTKQWISSLRTYVSPYFGNIDVRQVTTPLVLRALKPIWETTTVTASRVRGRIERILSWAAVQGYRAGENPARWRGHLEELLPNPSKLKKTRHFSSMPYQTLGEFLQLLETRKGIAARALALTILTARRTSEVLHAKWGEIDFARQVWVVPGARMKNGDEHCVPLNDASLEILRSLKRGSNSNWVFPGAKGKPLSSASMLAVLRRLGKTETVHGFRSSFRVWAAEKTAFPRELAELALAHKVGTPTEQAYQRSDLFEIRRTLMRNWAGWCATAEPHAGTEHESAFPGCIVSVHQSQRSRFLRGKYCMTSANDTTWL